MLGDDKLSNTDKRIALLIFCQFIILRTVDEADHIGILLDSTRLTQVGELRSFAVDVPLARLYATIELGEGDDRDFQFLGQDLERSRDGTYLLLTVAEGHPTGIHELEIVDDDHSYAVLTHESSRLGTQLEDG